MFRKQDFKKVDLLGSGKKNTKIYKALHIPSGKYYALKEVEAKTLDKLNEYKEEAVQLFKAQHNPNVIQFFGYFFYETMYNTFRIGIVCEYIDHRLNLEYMYRKRKQAQQYWKQEEIEKMLVSLISTLSHMQSVGLCHRDLKPANLFLMTNGEVKVIDFGESKDYFKNEEDGGNPTTATIRGTPQYLSPVLWKAHVVDGNSRFAKHNIYKSDVFSVGLMFYQLGSMEDVTGFNQKTTEYDGEKLIDMGIKKLKQRYNDSMCEVIRLMLKFNENERPSFIELAKLVLTTCDNTIEKDQNANLIITPGSSKAILPKINPNAINLIQKQILRDPSGVNKSGGLQEIQKSDIQFQQQRANNMVNVSPMQIQQRRPQSNQNFIGGLPHDMTESTQKMEGGGDFEDEEEELDPRNNLLTQSELFRNYAEQNNLYVNQTNNIFWFEYGGQRIGKMLIDIQLQAQQNKPQQQDSDISNPAQQNQITQNNAFKWKLIGKYKNEFPAHFAIVFVSEQVGFYILGGNGNANTCLLYDYKTLKVKANMPQEKTFFAAVHFNGIIYTFGGYDAYDKVQLSTCEYYDLAKDQWFNSPHDNAQGNVEYKMAKERSQNSCAQFDNDTIFIFGGYNRNEGTLNIIERFHMKSKKMELLELKMPSPLRRFAAMKISTTKILLLGGLMRMSKESDAVFCFDLEKEYTIEQLDKIDRPGIVDYPIIIDQVGNLHLFLENNSGTSPPSHIVYSFLEYS